jgi:hypothetical protein
MHIEVDVSGPVGDGRAEGAVARYREDVADTVAGQGVAEVHLILDRTIRQPTPYYETQIAVSSVGTDRVVHDRDVIYGPWLEGVGSRNRTTRFKGYFAFRIAAQMLRQQGTGLAEQVLRRYPELGGDG